MAGTYIAFSLLLSTPHIEHQDPRSAADGEAWHPPGHRAATEIPETFPACTFYGRRGGGSLVLPTGQHNWYICRRGIWNECLFSRYLRPVCWFFHLFKQSLCLCLSRVPVVYWQISLVSTLCLQLWCITLSIGAWRRLTLFTTFIHKPHYWT